MRKIYLTLFLFTLTRTLLFAQDYSAKYDTRTIVLNYPDSVVKVNVLITEEDFEIKEDCKYYWYNNDIIACNRGGINGKPLHGAYIVCNIDGILLTQGEFKHGLKSGKWKTWYTSGELKKVENWKEGLKNDTQRYYAENGNLVKEEKYKKGDKIVKTGFSGLKSKFRKKDKEEKAANDSIDIKGEVVEEERIKKMNQ